MTLERVPRERGIAQWLGASPGRNQRGRVAPSEARKTMKDNRDLGFKQIASVGEYEIGRNGKKFRAYGYEWVHDHDVSREGAHHEVCGRGETPEEAIDQMIEMAIVSGSTTERVHMTRVTGLDRAEAEKLRRELKEAVAELADA